MSNKIDVAAENDLSEGTMKAVTVEEQEVLLVRTKDGFHAVGNICPHMKGRLSQGTLDGTIVTCPRHGSQFNVTNGEVVRWLKGKGIVSQAAKIVKPPHNLDTYRLEVRDGRVWIELPA